MKFLSFIFAIFTVFLILFFQGEMHRISNLNKNPLKRKNVFSSLLPPPSKRRKKTHDFELIEPKSSSNNSHSIVNNSSSSSLCRIRYERIILTFINNTVVSSKKCYKFQLIKYLKHNYPSLSKQKTNFLLTNLSNNNIISINKESSKIYYKITNLKSIGSFATEIINENSFIQHYLGKMDVQCIECKALHFIQERNSQSSNNNPRFNMCCEDGHIAAPELPPLTPILEKYFSNTHEHSQVFFDNIRILNTMFSMGSIETTGSQMHFPGRGKPVYKINGLIHHRYGSLYSNFALSKHTFEKFRYL